MHTNFVPWSDRLLVRPDPPKARTSLLASTDSDKEEQTTGIVLSAGPVVVGDGNFAEGLRVHFNAYSGREIRLNGEKLLLMRVEEINGHFEETE